MYWFQRPVVVGLLLDIVGAFVIAWPDIPKVNRWLRSGRLRHGKYRLESGIPLLEKMSGHDEVVDEIEKFHQQIKDDDSYKVDHLSEQTPLTIHNGKIATPPGEDSNIRLQIGEVPYSLIEPIIEKNIREQEMRVRVVGFLLLAGGFTLQLIGQFV